jgi:hypothetical protein
MHANLLDWRGDLLFGGLTGFLEGSRAHVQGTGNKGYEQVLRTGGKVRRSCGPMRKGR